MIRPEYDYEGDPSVMDWKEAVGVDNPFHDDIDLNKPLYQHADGRQCRVTMAGRWLIRGEGLGHEALCPRSHDSMSADEADVSRLEKEIAELADEAPNLRRMAESRHADVVNMPDHYTKLPVECIDVTEHFNFTLGNAIKYIWRADHKGKPVEDLKKAVWYLQREIARRERDQ